MGLLGGINHVIEQAQQGVEHAANEAIHHVVNPGANTAVSTVNQVYELQKKVIGEAQKEATNIINQGKNAADSAIKAAQNEAEKIILEASDKASGIINGAQDTAMKMIQDTHETLKKTIIAAKRNIVSNLVDTLIKSLSSSAKWYMIITGKILEAFKDKVKAEILKVV